MLTWQLNAGWEERLEHALALLEELLGGEQAGEAELVDEDARRLDGLLAHHLGLDGPVEHLAVPPQDLLLHSRVEPLRICTRPARSGKETIMRLGEEHQHGTTHLVAKKQGRGSKREKIPRSSPSMSKMTCEIAALGGGAASGVASADGIGARCDL